MSQSSSNDVKNYYRFGAPEKTAFRNKTDSYYGITVSAHIAAYYSTSIKEFLRTLKKSFFVDPMTYVFARDPEHIKRKGKLRKSYKKLSEEYGKVIANIAGKMPLDYHVFGNSKVVDDFVKNVLTFQKEILRVPHVSLQKYFKILGENHAEIEAPDFLVAPYFYASSYDDPWYEVSLSLATRANNLKENNQLYPVICISREMLLDSSLVSKIKNDYAGFDGLIYWVSSKTNEENGDPSYLEGLKRFVSSLAKLKKPVYSLYGGYFTAMLSKYGLTGYSCGVCYGENKHVDAHPTGGGRPRRYYLPFSHIKVLEPDARTFFADYAKSNYKLLCNCDTCEKIKKEIEERLAVKGVVIDPAQYVDIFFTRFSMLDLREHFMDCRHAELSQISKETLNKLTERLTEEYIRCNKLGFSKYPGMRYVHLDKWKQTLQ